MLPKPILPFQASTTDDRWRVSLLMRHTLCVSPRIYWPRKLCSVGRSLELLAVSRSSACLRPGASSFEELIAKSRDRVASRRDEPQLSTQQQQDCSRQERAKGTEQRSGLVGGSEPAHEGFAGGAGLQNGASSDICEGPHRSPALARETGALGAKDLSGGTPVQCCGAYSAQQAGAPPQSMAGAGAETTRCTVYTREPGEKHSSACCGVVPDRVGFLKPLGLQDSVPDSASD